MSDAKKAGPAYSWEALLKAQQKDLEAIYGTFESGSGIPWEVRKALGEDAVELTNNQREFYVEDADKLKDAELKEEFEGLEKLVADKALRKKWHEHVKKMGMKKAFVDASRRMDKEIELGAAFSNKPKKSASQTESDEFMLADGYPSLVVVPQRPEPPSLLSSVPALKPHPQPTPKTAGTKRTEPEPEIDPPPPSVALPSYTPSINYEDFILQDSRRRSEAYYQSVFGKPTAKPRESPLPLLELARLPRGLQVDAIVKRARALPSTE